MHGYCPNGDPFYSEMANYDVTIKYPNDYALISTGVQSFAQDDAGRFVGQKL